MIQLDINFIYMSKTRQLMFFIIVHKNNNKVTPRTLAVNARGQKQTKFVKTFIRSLGIGCWIRWAGYVIILTIIVAGGL